MAGDAKNIPLVDLNLGAALLAKLAPITDTKGLRALRPVVLASEWKITERQWEKIDLALRSRGYGGLPPYEHPEPKTPRGVSLKGRCRRLVGGPPSEVIPADVQVPCMRPLLDGKRSCLWHWLEGQPIELQTEWADQRRRIAERDTRYGYRARVPEAEWPEGERWCSECQTFIPLFYCTGSRCKAHASRAAHASLTKRLYDFTREDYENLLAWQKGRCYICQQVPKSRRLAVDHDHRTMLVRGLLCASDEWGCNMTLRRLLNSPAMARRALEYVTKTPLERMQAGEEPVTIDQRSQVTRVRANEDDGPIGVRDLAVDPFAGF